MRSESTTDRYGAFVDLNARLSQRWILGGRYDYVEAPRGPVDANGGSRRPITWWQSEFVYLRLEGEHHHDSVEAPTTSAAPGRLGHGSAQARDLLTSSARAGSRQPHCRR